MFLDLISSVNYKKLNILDQQKIVLTFFYAENFYKLSVPEIIILLQEFERIKSIIDNREEFGIKIEESKEMLYDAAVSISKKNIYFSETLIKDGKQRNQNNHGKMEYKDIEFLNLFLLDCLLHEEFHISTFYALEQGLLSSYRELKELHMYTIVNGITNSAIQQKNINNIFYKYVMDPREYYAFKYAYDFVRKLMNTDVNILRYIKSVYDMREKVEESYRNNSKESFDYEAIYPKLLFEYILKYSKYTGYSCEEIIEDLAHSKSLSLDLKK